MTDYILESLAAGADHKTFSAVADPLPARGVAFSGPAGLRSMRLTDVADIPQGQPGAPWPYNGFPTRGLTNGYSTYSCANATGEYVIAFGCQSDNAYLYRADGSFVRALRHAWPGGSKSIGEIHDIRWDLSVKPETEYDFYYTDGAGLFKQHIAAPDSPTVIFITDANFRQSSHCDQGGDYRGFLLEDWRAGVVNIRTGRVMPTPSLPTGEVCISPSGAWAQVTQDLYSTPPREALFYRTADLEAGVVAPVQSPTIQNGHDGWAWDHQGNEVWVFQDNKTDWFSAFDPATGKRTDIFNMGQLGWEWGQHMSRMCNPAKRGWFLMSVYVDPVEPSWKRDNLVMVEIRPAAEGPRLWRLGPSLNTYQVGAKDASYFSEGFASLSPDGNSVYIGANWFGQSNLELYRIDLPATWDTDLSSAPTPPEPEPEPEPPTPDPEPEPTPARTYTVNLMFGSVPITGTITEETK